LAYYICNIKPYKMILKEDFYKLKACMFLLFLSEFRKQINQRLTGD